MKPHDLKRDLPPPRLPLLKRLPIPKRMKRVPQKPQNVRRKKKQSTLQGKEKQKKIWIMPKMVLRPLPLRVKVLQARPIHHKKIEKVSKQSLQKMNSKSVCYGKNLASSSTM